MRDLDALALRRLAECLDDALGLVEVPVLRAEGRTVDAFGNEPWDELGCLLAGDESRWNPELVLERDVLLEDGVRRGRVGDE